MPIDKIGSAEHYVIVKRNLLRPQSQSNPHEQDMISLTETARQNAELLRIRDLVMAAPDIRSDKISKLQNKYQNPSYPDQIIIASLADILLDHWLK